MRSLHCLILLTLLMSGCGQLRGVLPVGGPATDRQPDGVTIARDEWGVPHVFGGDAAEVAFGIGWAQAEDGFWQIEETYLHALGRASHWYGERYLASDLLQAAFETERLAREEYEREPADRRAVWDAFAAGINHYIASSGVRPRLITLFEPWMPFALARSIPAGTVVDGVLLGRAVVAPDVIAAYPGEWIGPSSGRATDPTVRTGVLSAGVEDANAGVLWAVAPSLTEAGHALVLHTESGSFTGPVQPYEMMLHSDDGWHVRGVAVRGTPVPAGGRNRRIAWAHSPTAADAADLYEVTFDDDGDPLSYRFDGQLRQAVEWEDTLRVNTPAGVVARVFRFRRTHHGPIVALRDGVALALRVARMEEGGSLQQLLAESRAEDLATFRTALDQRALTGNTVYADVEGNIYHSYGGAVPTRDPALDWRTPVDGSTSATEWRDYHALNELPEVLNPARGWIRSGDGGSIEGDGGAGRHPVYMIGGAADDRSRRERALLAAESSWTLDALSAAAFDMHVPAAGSDLAALVAEWEHVGGQDSRRARRLDEPLDVLRNWDGDAGADSEAATLYVLWQERLRSMDAPTDFGRFRAMEAVLADLEAEFGDTAVAWGELNRLRAPAGDAAGAVVDPLNLPVGGAPHWGASLFTLEARRTGESLRRHGVGGTRWIQVMQLGPEAGFRSVVPFGQSADPASPHAFDQADLYTARMLKPGMFLREEVLGGATRVYRPGR